MNQTNYSPFPSKKYGIIYADPPWNYKGQTMHNGPGGETTGGSAVHYPTITLDGLKQLDVSSIAEEDCLLFLWTTSPHLDQAIELGKEWGFAYATVGFVWDKKKVNPGFYTMSQVELCLIMKRGKIPQPRGSRNERQLVSEERQFHSRKPDIVRHRIDNMFPDHAKIELFARERVDNWDAWGRDL